MKSILKRAVALILQKESKLVLWKYKPKVVAITGSVGKTSTKDAVYTVLSQFSYVRRSEKSYNSEFGLPLTILGLRNGWNNPLTWLKNILKGFWLFVWPHKYPKWLILEVGIGKPGDMRKTASWLLSDVVIMTAIGETPAHIEFFESRKHLVEEKMQLIKTLKKDGLLILNADDNTVLEMKNKSKNRVVTYGFKEYADIKASGISIHFGSEGEPEGIMFRIDEGGSSLPVTIKGTFGKNHIYASLGGLALAYGLKLNMLWSTDALKKYVMQPGRMRLLEGINDSTIIDDTYNSSPAASISGLETLGEMSTVEGTTKIGRKIAVLGDMLELGRHTEEAHKNVGKVAKYNVNILVVVGPRAKGIKEGAQSVRMAKKNIFEFSSSIEAGEFLKTFVRKNDLVFIKGSQGMRMERAVFAILKDKENKDKLLVRQEKEWEKR